MGRSEQGAVAIVLAVGLIGLMALAALAMDMSLLYNWRSKDQNAADHAALAAAWASCHSEDPEDAAMASAADNGFDNDGTTNTVTVSALGSGRYEVIVRSWADSVFSDVIGIDQIRAGARAVAKCSTGGGEFVIFAGATDCGKLTLDWPGSSADIEGDVHSNGGITVAGSNNTVLNGQTTYVLEPPDISGTGNNLSLQKTEVQDWPVTFSITDYEPGGAKATLAGAQYYTPDTPGQKIDMGWLTEQGLYDDTTHTLEPGLYYTSGDIVLSASGPSETEKLTGTVTFVTSGGTITVSGSNQDLQPWDPDGLLVFSNKDTRPTCDEFVIKFDGSQNNWKGFIYGPYGMIEMPGSGNVTFAGSVVGRTVRLNGSNLTMSTLPDTSGVPSLLLLE